ncbi:MAG TPA: putative glycoside hydrolase [Gemmatimonadales bacterium]
MKLPRAGNALSLLAAIALHRGLFAQQAPPALVVEQLARAARPALRPVDVRYVQPELRILASSHSPDGIKALYVNAWAFGSTKLWHLVRLADSTEINALVVDVKDDTGCLLYPSAVATARAIGAGACARTKTIRERLDTLHAHGIYPIARIVVAKDPLLAERKHGWAVRERETGELWRDRIGSAWVDAHNDSVWIYAAQLAAEAVLLGFREVQFDYVRFPDEPAERMATAIFPARRRGETQRTSVQRHVRLIVQRLEHLGVPVTFDVFGLTASATGDLGIGQVWEDFTTVADVVLPMVYPSHYYRGAFGLERPNAHPYLVVRRALQEALERSQDAGTARIRPYLQAFTLGRRLPRYTAHEIREQIRAAEELGLTSWVLWNPRSVYQKDALRPNHRASVRGGSFSFDGSVPR